MAQEPVPVHRITLEIPTTSREDVTESAKLIQTVTSIWRASISSASILVLVRAVHNRSVPFRTMFLLVAVHQDLLEMLMRAVPTKEKVFTYNKSLNEKL